MPLLLYELLSCFESILYVITSASLLRTNIFSSLHVLCCNVICILSFPQIGWRIFRSNYATKQPLHKRCTNVLYPAFIFIMLCVTSVFQVLSCFFRNRVSTSQSNSCMHECAYAIVCAHAYISLTIKLN